MNRFRSYRAPMLLGLIGGLVVTYVLMNYVWSMKPFEAAVAEEEYQNHLLQRAVSPDGKWIASLVRQPAMDDRNSCLVYLERNGATTKRAIFGDSLSIEDPRFYELKWSVDSLRISVYGGSTVIWKYDVRDVERSIAARRSR